MGKDKKTGKDILRPSTTRGGTDLPTRPHFSPNATTSAPKVTPTALPSYLYLGHLLLLKLNHLKKNMNQILKVRVISLSF